jgi:hypothetical protein
LIKNNSARVPSPVWCPAGLPAGGPVFGDVLIECHPSWFSFSVGSLFIFLVYFIIYHNHLSLSIIVIKVKKEKKSFM